MAVTAGAHGAFVLAVFPGTVNHTDPPDDANTGDLTALPFSSSWAYYEGQSSTGDDFTQIDSCDIECQQNHQIPANTRHEYAFGGTLTIDESPSSATKPNAVPGSYGATIEVSVSCN